MNDICGLDVFLYNEHIGTIVNLYGDRNVFSFSEAYIENTSRPTLSLSFKGVEGNLITDMKSTRTRLTPFFSNLLPEGSLREYLAAKANVNIEREFYLLKILGRDLPGAISIKPAQESSFLGEHTESGVVELKEQSEALRFSLAGVQLKFSAIWDEGKRLTIPTEGIGGSWIVKLPSRTFSGVAENEFVMMSLASQIGIEVPRIKLLPVEDILNIPTEFKHITGMAYAIERFDREKNGEKIHIEDFAQVFNVYPQQKYDTANYQNIARVIWYETGERGIIEFIRRIIFNVLIGNGDMHLKNWSLLYKDRIQSSLAPAYDFVSTIPYIPDDKLALNFVDSKKFSSVSTEQLIRFAAKTEISEQLVLDTALDTVRRFKMSWMHVEDLGLDSSIKKLLEAHMKSIPLYGER